MQEQALANNGNRKFYRKKNTRSRSAKKKSGMGMPRLLKEAAKILHRVEGGETIPNCIYQTKIRNIKRLHQLVATANENQHLLNEILEKSALCAEKYDPYMIKILVTELLWGMKVLPPLQISEVVGSYQSKLEAAVEESTIPISLQKVEKPRYARVNTLLSTVEGTVNLLKDMGWLLMDTPSSYKRFLKTAKKLEENEFLKDFHFEDLLVFSPKVSWQLGDLKMVQEHKLLPQDKAAYVPPLLLNPSPGSTVLDMCAAPGKKTAHLATLMKNKGCVYAVDMDQKRLSILDGEIPKLCGMHHCVKSMLKDCSRVTADSCPNVKYILIDPPCTGTGPRLCMEVQDIDTSVVKSKRLEHYSRFQERLLVQALTAFPSVERIVYTTCSVLKEENEEVIKRALAKVPKFHVVSPTVTGWKKRGNPNYEFGSNCLVANQVSDLMNGFFVAVIERIEKTVEGDGENVSKKVDEGWMIPKKTFRKRKLVPSESESQEVESMDVDSQNVTVKKKKKLSAVVGFEVKDMIE